jgi:hypothetical protein
MVSFATRRVGVSMHRLVGPPSGGRRKWRGASASLTAGCSVHEVLRKSSEIATGRRIMGGRVRCVSSETL